MREPGQGPPHPPKKKPARSIHPLVTLVWKRYRTPKDGSRWIGRTLVQIQKEESFIPEGWGFTKDSVWEGGFKLVIRRPWPKRVRTFQQPIHQQSVCSKPIPIPPEPGPRLNHPSPGDPNLSEHPRNLCHRFDRSE